MTPIPPQPPVVITAEDLRVWDEMKNQLALLRNQEMALRKRIFGALFPNPVEGTNKHPLANGWELKATHTIDRQVDTAAFTSMRELFVKEGLPADTLVRWKAELAKAEYNKLTQEEQFKFDRCMVIKPGSPSMEIVLPAKARKAQENT